MGKHHWWAPPFLVALERSGMIRASARAVGVGRRTVYDRRERDPEFRAMWDEALAPFRRGERAYDRRPLAAFPAHRALAPLEEISADVGAVSVDELEAWLGCSLDEYAEKVRRYGARGDRELRRIMLEWSYGIHELASRARGRARKGETA